MFSLAPTSSHLASLLTTVCIAGLWQGTALALLASALLRLMPRASAGLRHTLLVCSFVTALVLPWVGQAHLHGEAGVSAAHTLSLSSWIAFAVAALWLFAAGGRAVQLSLAWLHLRRVRLSAVPITLQGARDFAAGGRRAVLCASDAVDSPTVLGFFRPALLLPLWMVPALSADELCKIAAHECEHLRRRDDWLNLLLQAGLVLSPLNPALLWLNRRIGVQRELACDAAVVASTGEPIAYASCLARLAEQRMQRRGHLRLALAAWERRSELAQRVHALLQQRTPWSAAQSSAASAMVAVALLTASAGLAHAPQFVRITEPEPAAAIASVSHDAVVRATAAVPHVSFPVAEGSFRMVPVSFTARQVPPAHRTKRARRQVAVPGRLTKPASSVLPARRDTQATMLRIAAHPATTQMYSDAVSDDSTPVRLVPAELSTPYVAVPVPNGWLLIEL